MKDLKFTLYSKLVSGTRNKTIKTSNDLDNLYELGLKHLNKDFNRQRDYFIVEHGVRAIKITNSTIL